MKLAGLGSALLGIGLLAAWATWRVVTSLPPGAEPNPYPDDPFLALREVFIGWTDADGLQPVGLRRTQGLVERLRRIDGVESVLSLAGSDEATRLLQLPLIKTLIARGAERNLLSADHTRSGLLCKLVPHAAAWPEVLSHIDREAKLVYPDAAIVGLPVLSRAARLQTRRTAVMRAWGFALLLPLLVSTFSTSRQALVLTAVGIATIAAGMLAVLCLPPNAADVAATLLPPLVTAAMLVAAERILGTTERRPNDEPVRRPLVVTIIVVAVLAAAAFGILQIRWQHGARRVVPPGHRLVEDWDFVDRHFNGLRFDYVRIPVEASFTWAEYDQLHRLQERLRGVAGVRNVAGLNDLLRAFAVPGSRLLPADRVLDNLRTIMPESVEHFRSPIPEVADASSQPAADWSRLLVFYDSDADIDEVLRAHREATALCHSEVPSARIEGLAVYECEQLSLARWALRVAMFGWVLLTAIVFRPSSRGPRPWLFAALPGLVYFGGLGVWDGLMTSDRAAIGIWIAVVGFLLGRKIESPPMTWSAADQGPTSLRDARRRWIGLTILSVFAAGQVPVVFREATIVEPLFGLLGLLAALLIVELLESGG